MSIYTRVTVAGAQRRVEVVVPSAEPLGAAVPRLLDLLGETAGTVARPLAVVAPDGEQIDIALTPQQLDLVDGSLVRLVRLDAAPPPPVVIDVTDAAADAHDARPDRWDDRSRAIAGSAGIAAAFALAGGMAPWGDPAVGAFALLGVALFLLGATTALGLGGLRRLSVCVAAAAAGLALPVGGATAAALGAARYPATAALVAGIAAAIAVGSTAVILAVGVAHRRRGAAAGGAVGAVLASLLLGLVLARVDVVSAAAITGVVAAFATGPLPWIALAAAGLTDLDQRAADGSPPTRSRTFAAIDEAYAALTWSVAATASVLGVTGVVLAFSGTVWTELLALALFLVAALRTRAFPLRSQGWLLWAAAGVIAASALTILLSGDRAWIGAAVAVVAAAVISALVLVRPRPHVRARLRGVGNVIETLAVISLLPLLVGALGVYADLLAMFGGRS
ncbi:glycosyltransferase, probably [Microbacterium testaceum StLB037]|uniref:Glycosyltransferase, probably n=1 Tax=Microbacterium testaceum (strain StLB037) TaxID=979556 RepID=E8NBY4_MICTS|nr:EsaB/YukD family protein [Microbacterium testaceum]BAJ74817.1 glycosyltransferase, probably [Microbacterium testaceum StLB037]